MNKIFFQIKYFIFLFLTHDEFNNKNSFNFYMTFSNKKNILMFSFFVFIYFFFFVVVVAKMNILIYNCLPLYIYWNNVILLIEFNINILFNALIDRENKHMLNNFNGKFQIEVSVIEWMS